MHRRAALRRCRKPDKHTQLLAAGLHGVASGNAEPDPTMKERIYRGDFTTIRETCFTPALARLAEANLLQLNCVCGRLLAQLWPHVGHGPARPA